MRRSMTCALFFGMSLATVNATAFDEAGHFYTAYALAVSIPEGGDARERLLVALCAQLPDMSADLDAVTVYSRAITKSPWAWIQWGTSDKINSLPVRKMITVQHLLHALTGGSSESTEAVALRNVEILRERLDKATAKKPEDLCALGFALHFLGDSVAHQMLDDPSKMYKTGRGHAADLHYPDYALCDGLASAPRIFRHCSPEGIHRFAKWKNLWSGAPKTYDPAGLKFDAAKRKQMIDAVAGLEATANDSNDWNESDMRVILASKRTEAGAYRDFIESHKSDDSCEKVLAEATKLPDLTKFAGLTCAAVWSSYIPSIKSAFDERGAGARSDLSADFKSVYVDDVLDK